MSLFSVNFSEVKLGLAALVCRASPLVSFACNPYVWSCVGCSGSGRSRAGRQFEEHSNGKGAYVKPVLRFMPARMVETERIISKCSYREGKRKHTKDCVKRIV